MRKKGLFIVLLFTVIYMAGCGFNVEIGGENKEKEEKQEKDEGLSLHVTQVDEEAGVTLEDEPYKSLNDMIKEEGNIGAKNDFSIYTVDTMKNSDGTPMLLLIGVNRLPDPIENIRFDLTIKNENDEFIYEDSYVHISEEVGEIPANGVKPFLIEATEEQVELLQAMDQSRAVLELNDFKFD